MTTSARNRAADESVFRERRTAGATFYTSRRRHEDLTIVVKRFPPRGVATRDFVLVHGIGVSSRYFQPLAAELARFGTVWVIDLPGYGASPDPRSSPTIADHARVVASFLRESEIENPVLVGHSMGTQIVSRIAVDRPETTDRIVLIGPTMQPKARTLWRAAARLMRDVLVEPPRANWVVVTDYLFRCGIPYYLRQLPHLLTDPLEERLPLVQAKALVVRGHRDGIAPPEWCERIVSLIPDARFETVRGPHVVMFTDPERTAELIHDFAA